ncbi:MAG: pyruvate ferredoxin oxidoreductase subunit gamma [Chloroflexota bacterium]
MIGIRWHGRGGQGAVTSAELLARAAIDEGKYAQAFPAFGPERRGAPVVAFNRISEKEPIRIRTEVDDPDVVVVLDASLTRVVNVTSGLKDDGVLIVNTKSSLQDIEPEFKIKSRIAVVDATKIAREVLGVNIVNTAMLGALLKATGLVKMESLLEPLKHRFERLADRNLQAMKRAFDETIIRSKVVG